MTSTGWVIVGIYTAVYADRRRDRPLRLPLDPGRLQGQGREPRDAREARGLLGRRGRRLHGRPARRHDLLGSRTGPATHAERRAGRRRHRPPVRVDDRSAGDPGRRRDRVRHPRRATSATASALYDPTTSSSSRSTSCPASPRSSIATFDEAGHLDGPLHGVLRPRPPPDGDDAGGQALMESHAAAGIPAIAGEATTIAESPGQAPRSRTTSSPRRRSSSSAACSACCCARARPTSSASTRASSTRS